jgi:membrane-associated phospholipid phosphatase
VDVLQSWGVGLILTLQQLSPGLDGLMRFLSFLGQEEFYAVLVPFVYWCVDTTSGVRLLGVLIVSDFVNGLAKLAFHAPRPYWVSTEVRALGVEPSYGIPSGHAQTGIPFWGEVARRVARPWAPAAAGVVVLGVSLSRVYLGVHFPHDVLAGWVIGAALLLAAVRTGPRLAAWWGARPLGAQVAAAFLLSLAMLVLLLAAHASLAGVTDPPVWAEQAADAAPPPPGRPAIDPRSMDGPVADLGLILGAGAGLALGRLYAPFDPRGPWRHRLARLGLGLVALLIVRVGLALVFPREPMVLGLVFRYVRYASLGLTALWLMPWLFLRLGIARARV